MKNPLYTTANTKLAGSVVAVSRSPEHGFSKNVKRRITLRANYGVVGDAHAGVTVQHRSRVAQDPDQPNLRQVHLIHKELLDELADKGYELRSGELGENILTQGIGLLELPQRTVLHIGPDVKIEVTGLRNPCRQIENFRAGLLGEVIGKNEYGEVVRKTGIMGIVLSGGDIAIGDSIQVELPEEPHLKLERV